MPEINASNGGNWTEGDGLGNPFKAFYKRVMAGNPCYLASAGLLLYGINRLTTDAKIISAELPMLKFNFCALLIYEIILVITAISLARRKVWYDAMLLFGLANLFIIVPFSLISRTVFENSHLALYMCIGGSLMAAAKIWAFKRYIPELHLPRSLLTFGALLLTANACAPLWFNRIVDNPAQVREWCEWLWLLGMPVVAALANFLPGPMADVNLPRQIRGLPLLTFFAWVLVTACHLGGLGYSTTFDWDASLLVPVVWVVAWTVRFRIGDFTTNPGKLWQRIAFCFPLFAPLLGHNSNWIFPLFAGVNVVAYALQFALKARTRFDLILLLGSVAILLGALPMTWIHVIVPEASRASWLGISIFAFSSWLIFLSRDPRVGMVGALSFCLFSIWLVPPLSYFVVQVALISLLGHSLRWDDSSQWGAAVLRNLAGLFWLGLSFSWLCDSPSHVHFLVDPLATLLLFVCLFRGLIWGYWRPAAVLVYPALFLLIEPSCWMGQELSKESPGVIAIGASFLLFGLGSLAAFSKAKR